ncbi:hypothetical protein HZR84_13920 [Hyphobacterium sp. CCMP332]|nr:hypothetical protein HZR84_13920 [Hyphobacterium sp. CCMP332]
MKLLRLVFIFIMSASIGIRAQTMSEKELNFFKEIPEYEGQYNSGKISARMIDGLGFRFYWATEGLSVNDMSYRPSEDIRSIGETIQHIYEMSNSLLNVVNLKAQLDSDLTSTDKQRAETLKNLKLIRDKLFSSSDEDFEGYNRMSKNGESIPFWKYINGPIEDCIWHCGQIASFRRLAGNPITQKVSFFNGKMR